MASTEDRRAQIVTATLRLLASTPLTEISTRQIARRLKLSQPALFRHFRSRDAILLAVVAHARERIEAELLAVLRGSSDPQALIVAVGQAIARQAEAMPGLPRLLFAEASGAEGALRGALVALTAAPRAMFAELLRQGQREGRIDPGADPEQVARALLALLQGAALQSLLQRPAVLEGEVAAHYQLLLRGLTLPAAPARPAVAAPARPAVAGAAARGPRLIAVDAKALLAQGTEPLGHISGATERVGPSGLVLVTAPFRPGPLIALMEGRGHAVHSFPGQRGGTQVAIVVGAGLGLTDLSELAAPEPLHHMMRALAALVPGQAVLARLPRYPTLLIPELERPELSFELLELEDETVLLWVERG